MKARFETAEVSLTATIGEVFGQFLNPIVAWDVPRRYQFAEPVTRDLRQCGRLFEGQNSLRVKRKGKLITQPRLHLAFRKAKAPCDRVRHLKRDAHLSTLSVRSGVFLVKQRAPLANVIEALLLIWAASDADEWKNRIVEIPQP